MKIKLKASDITSEKNHISTTYNILNKDGGVIVSKTSTDEKNSTIIDIDDIYTNQVIYASIVYHLNGGEDIAEEIININGKPSNIKDFYPPNISIKKNKHTVDIDVKPFKSYLNKSDITPQVEINIYDAGTDVLLETFIVKDKLSISLSNIPVHVSIIDIDSVYVINNIEVSTHSRKSTNVNFKSLKVSNTKYNTTDIFGFNILISSFKYIDLINNKPIAYAKILHKNGIIDLRPRADNALAFYGNIPTSLTNPVLGIDVKVGGTLITETYELKEVS